MWSILKSYTHTERERERERHWATVECTWIILPLINLISMSVPEGGFIKEIGLQQSVTAVVSEGERV